MDEVISFPEFQRLDIRIGTITDAERVEETDKLFKLTVDIGIEKRTLVAGLGEVVDDPKSLIGKQVPVLTNLEPKTIHKIESKGMILAIEEGGMPVLLHPEKKVLNGSIVR